MNQTTDTCRKCESTVAPNAVICTNCGTHLSSGMDMHTVKKVETAKKAGSAVFRTIIGIALAFIFSIIGAAVFAFTKVILPNTIIFYLTAFGAVAVGAIAGITFAGFFKERNMILGVLAVIPAVFGMLVGEVLEANWSTGRFAEEIVEDNSQMCEMVYFNRYIKRKLKRDTLKVNCDTKTVFFEFDKEDLLANDLDYDSIHDEAMKDMAADNEVVQARVVKAFLERNWTMIDRIKLGFGFADLIWFGIAIAAAFRIARGTWGNGLA